MPLSWAREQKLAIGLGVVLALVLGAAIVACRAARALSDAEDQVAQAHVVLTALEATISAINGAETGQRGYLITGEAIYLETYRTAIASIDRRLARIKRLTAEDSALGPWIAGLERAITEHVALLERGVSLRREQGFEAARRWTRTGRGREGMEDIRAHIDKLASAERRVVGSRRQESRQSRQQVILGLTIEALLSFALVVLVYDTRRRALGAEARGAELLRAAQGDLDRRVQERTAAIEHSNQELQDFAFVASHDLQEPLRKIQAFGGRLKHEYGPVLEAQGRDYLDRMQNAAQRMRNLIDDLLTLSRVTTTARPFIPVALDEVAREVVSDLEGRIEETGGRLEVGGLPTIEADPLQMRQLLQNLIGNALKFHRPDEPPCVQVRSAILEATTPSVEGAPTDRSCEIAVIDNGIGIDEQYRDKVFGPFQRLHARSEYEGTGIGLAVCRKIVERHGGAIRLTSTLGAGTTFLVTLPITHTKDGETP